MATIEISKDVKSPSVPVGMAYQTTRFMIQRAAILAVLLAGSAAPAAAEVCDKERPAWKPSDGRVYELENPLFIFDELTGWIALAVIVIALVAARYRVKMVCAMLMSFLAVHVYIDWWGNGITYAARREGCVSYPYVATATLILISAGLTFIALRSRENARR